MSRGLLPAGGLSIVALLLLLPVAGRAQGAACSEPKVDLEELELHEDAYQKLIRDYPFTTRENWESYIGSRITQGLGFEPYSAPDREYWVTVGIYRVGDAYLFIATVVDLDTARIVKHLYFEALDFEAGLAEMIAKIGLVKALIRAYEMQYPAPPRDPTIKITETPEEVIAEQGKDKSEITVIIHHCNGLPAYSPPPEHKVLFKKENKRGNVKAHFWEGAWTYTFTRGGGRAKATYTLDYSKGTHAGTDTVEIRSRRRGRKMVHSQATIRIVTRGEGWIGVALSPQYAERCDLGQEIRQESARIPFRVIGTEDPCRYEVEGETSNSASFEITCDVLGAAVGVPCREIDKGRRRNRLRTGVDIDFNRDPERPFALAVLHDWSQTERIRRCPGSEKRDQDIWASGWFPMHENSWPLQDGFSEEAGIFRYTLQFDPEDAERLRKGCFDQ